jgi:hypothetical protein
MLLNVTLYVHCLSTSVIVLCSDRSIPDNCWYLRCNIESVGDKYFAVNYWIELQVETTGLSEFLVWSYGV